MSAEIKAEWLEKQVQKVREQFSDGFQLSDIPSVFKIGMESVELLKDLSGAEKEQMVMDLGHRAIDTFVSSWFGFILRPVLHWALDKWGRGFIQLAVGASKGNLAVN